MSDFGLSDIERTYLQPIHRETYFQHYNEKETRERKEERRKKRSRHLYYHDEYGNLYFKNYQKQQKIVNKPKYEIGVYYYTQDSSYMYYYDEFGYVHYYEIVPLRSVYNSHPHEPNYSYRYYGTWKAEELEQYYQSNYNGYY